MAATVATFKVQDVIHVTGRTDTYLAGKIESGQVRAGMRVKMLVDRDAYMSARIKSIEFVRDLNRESNVALALDTPDDVLRAAWKNLYRQGEILAIDEQEEAAATHSPHPDSPCEARTLNMGQELTNSHARIVVLISMALFALLSFSSLFTPLECFVPNPSYLISHVEETALPIEVATGGGYLALCAIAARRNQKSFAVFVLLLGVAMALVTFLRFIVTAASSGEI